MDCGMIIGAVQVGSAAAGSADAADLYRSHVAQYVDRFLLTALHHQSRQAPVAVWRQ